MQYLDVTDGRIAYCLNGPVRAPVLVLSNSLGTTWEIWDRQTAALARYLRVLQYDSRGHGRSPAAPAACSLALLAGDVLALLDRLEVSAAHFCGLSLGGMVGLWLAAHRPDRIRRLVLANTAAWLGPAELWNARINAVHERGLAAIAEQVVERWFSLDFRARTPHDVEPVRAMLLATPAAGYVACCTAIRDMDQRSDLHLIQARTLVVAGQFDPATTPESCRELAESIRGARYIELPAAHLSNVEAADAFNACVLDFLLS